MRLARSRAALDVRTRSGAPLPPGPYGTPTVVVEGGTWHLFYERDDKGVWLATSTDRRVWTNVQRRAGDPARARRLRPPRDRAQPGRALQGRYYGVYHANADPQWKGPWTTCLAVSDDLVHWRKYPGNPIVRSDDSSGILVDDGERLRLYTMHPQVKLWLPKGHRSSHRPARLRTELRCRDGLTPLSPRATLASAHPNPTSDQESAREACMATTLVTGTSTGIGHATALHMARKGHRVFATLRDPARADLGACPGRGARGHGPSARRRQRRVGKAAVDQVLSLAGRIDALVNNAGIGLDGPLEEMPLSDIRQVMETNFFGALRCMKAVVPSMRANGGGHVVNVTSVAGRIASAAQGAYCASKWALEAASEVLAQEVAQFGIRVAIVEPGIIHTPIFGKPSAPAPDTKYTHTRRLHTLFEKANQHPVSPFVVAERIEAVISTGNATLRHPVGPDRRALPGLAPLDVRRGVGGGRGPR